MAMNVCPMCGKQKVIMWPQFWPYRRGETYYCSEDCMMVDQAKDMKLIHMVAHVRAKKGNKMIKKISDEQKARAVQIAIEGGNPLPYLKSCGSKNPSASWAYIKNCLAKKDPETFAKLQETKEPAGGALSMTFTVKPDGTFETLEAGKVEVVETPEKPKQIYNPVMYDGMVIREVEGLFGRYRRSDVGGAVYIDFENADRIDTLSFTVEQWRSFGKEFVKCARILGVEM